MKIIHIKAILFFAEKIFDKKENPDL